VPAAKTMNIVSKRIMLKFYKINSVRTEAIPVEEGSDTMRVRVLAFARLRELLEAPERSLVLSEESKVADAWSALVREYPALANERSSTRAARNGHLVSFDEVLADGDELALLPPVGGG
jgi:molybdopterin converting factor small subunit